MILPDDTPASPSKLDSPQLPVDANTPAGSSAVYQQPQQPEVAPPPAYTAPVSYHQQPQHPYRPHVPLLHPILPTHTVPNEGGHKYTGQSPGKRFFKAFFVAILIWMLTGMLLGAMVDVSGSSHGWVVRVEPDDLWNTWPFQSTLNQFPSGPRPEDGRTVSCVQGDGWRPEHSIPSATFELPLSAEQLYFFNRGVMISGNVSIHQDAALKPNDHMVVDFSVYKAWDHELLSHLQVCVLRGSGLNDWRVGIFTPDTKKQHRNGWTMFEVHIDIRIPPPSSGSDILRIPQLRAKLPNFSYQLGDLAQGVRFGDISLIGSNARITAGSVAANSITLETSNQPIIGDFSADNSILLTTTNAAIEGRAVLSNNNRDEESILKLRTSNAHVSTAVVLKSSSPNGEGGDFDLSAITSNGALHMTVSKSPLNSNLDFTAITSNAPVVVKLPREFEGKYRVIAPVGNTHFEYDERAEDPSGLGRRRSVWSKTSGRRLEGYAAWGPIEDDGGRRGTGKVVVDTTNGPAFLKLL